MKTLYKSASSPVVYVVKTLTRGRDQEWEGVETVGPVTALEVLAEFPGDGIKPLQDFNCFHA